MVEATRGGAAMYLASSEEGTRPGVVDLVAVVYRYVCDAVEPLQRYLGRSLDDEAGAGEGPAVGKKASSLKRPVTSVDQLRRADHVAFYRGYYWHHAIVVGVDREKRRIEMIHYYSTTTAWLSEPKLIASLAKTAVRFDEQRFFVVEYGSDECLADEDVVRRAEDAVVRGKEYSPFSYNCEHFAVECKRGVKKSLQTETLRSRFVGWLLKGGFSVGVAALDGFVERTTLLSTAVNGGVWSVLVDIGYASYTIYRDYGRLRNREMTKREFEDSVGIAVVIAVHSVAGSAIGTVVGRIVIPQPLVGSVVGAVVGNICGNVLGFLGGVLGSAVRMAWNPDLS